MLVEPTLTVNLYVDDRSFPAALTNSSVALRAAALAEAPGDGEPVPVPVPEHPAAIAAAAASATPPRANRYLLIEILP